MFSSIIVLQILTTIQAAIVAEGFVPWEFKYTPTRAGFFESGEACFMMKTAEGAPLADVNLVWSQNITGFWDLQCGVGSSGAKATDRDVVRTAEQVVRTAIHRAKHGVPSAENVEFIKAKAAPVRSR